MPNTDSARRSVLVITRNLPPLRGGMERLNHRLAIALTADYQVAVCGPIGCGELLKGAISDVLEVPHKPVARFLIGALLASMRLAWLRRPSLVLAGSGLTAPLAWLAARLSGARFIAYLHGLDLVVPNFVYRVVWLPFIRRADLALVNSANTCRVAAECGVPIFRLHVLHPGTNLPGPDSESGRLFRETHGLSQRPVLLSVGRITPRKGLADFVSQALPRILAAHPDAVLLVIGDDASDAVRVEPSSERKRVKAAAERAGVDSSLRFLPPCDDTSLSAAYRAADVHVFPVRDLPGDIEGFGMVAIEAAAHGLTTVAFEVGGVADAVVAGRSGDLIAAGDYQTFAEAVIARLNRRGDGAMTDDCLQAAAAFGWDQFNVRLTSLLRDLTVRATQ